MKWGPGYLQTERQEMRWWRRWKKEEKQDDENGDVDDDDNDAEEVLACTVCIDKYNNNNTLLQLFAERSLWTPCCGYAHCQKLIFLEVTLADTVALLISLDSIVDVVVDVFGRSTVNTEWLH